LKKRILENVSARVTEIVQIVLQGFLMKRITKKISEDKLMVFGPLLMMLGMFLMPIIPNIAVFLASMTMISSGNGIMRTIVPSFISKRAQANEQGGVLGLTQSVSTIARVPGPLVGGSFFEFSGPAAPFLLSGTLLLFSIGLSYRTFYMHTRLGQDM
jgi:MFS family permease